MRAEKAAKVHSYLVRNSARASIRRREPKETMDYYEKLKYLDSMEQEPNAGREADIPGKDIGRETDIPGKGTAQTGNWVKRSKKAGRKVFGRISAWSLVSFVMVIIMILFVLKFVG